MEMFSQHFPYPSLDLSYCFSQNYEKVNFSDIMELCSRLDGLVSFWRVSVLIVNESIQLSRKIN
jgi:hypothetical protein